MSHIDGSNLDGRCYFCAFNNRISSRRVTAMNNNDENARYDFPHVPSENVLRLRWITHDHMVLYGRKRWRYYGQAQAATCDT